MSPKPRSSLMHWLQRRSTWALAVFAESRAVCWAMRRDSANKVWRSFAVFSAAASSTFCSRAAFSASFLRFRGHEKMP